METPQTEVRIACEPKTGDPRFRKLCDKYWQVTVNKFGNAQFVFPVADLEAEYGCKYLPDRCTAYAEGTCLSCGATARYEIRNRTEYVKRFYKGVGSCQACSDKARIEQVEKQREVERLREQIFRDALPEELRKPSANLQHTGKATAKTARVDVELGESKEVIRFTSLKTYAFNVDIDATVSSGSVAGTVLLKGQVSTGDLAQANDRDMFCYLVRVARNGTFGLDRVHEKRIGKRSVLVADEHIGWSQSIHDELESELFKVIGEDFDGVPSKWEEGEQPGEERD